MRIQPSEACNACRGIKISSGQKNVPTIGFVCEFPPRASRMKYGVMYFVNATQRVSRPGEHNPMCTSGQTIRMTQCLRKKRYMES